MIRAYDLAEASLLAPFNYSEMVSAAALGLIIFNEFPDRIADTLLLVPAGYAAGHPWLGWLCALLAALTAYVRVFGGSLGLPQDFSGLMAKQRRMAALTIGLVAQSIEWFVAGSQWSLLVTCGLIALGSAETCVSRTIALGRALEQS